MVMKMWSADRCEANGNGSRKKNKAESQGKVPLNAAMAMTREHTSRKLKRTANHLSDDKGTECGGCSVKSAPPVAFPSSNIPTPICGSLVHQVAVRQSIHFPLS